MLKVLVATQDTQGQRDDDYNWTVEGELVWVQEPCATDLRRMPNACGCGRGFAGVASHRATSTAKVVESSLTLTEYIAAIRTTLADGGWPPSSAESIAQGLVTFASEWEEGSVLQRDVWVFESRRGRLADGGTLLSWVAHM